MTRSGRLRTADCVGAAVGLAMDRRWGEPPDAVHPVIGIGKALEWLEARIYQDRRSSGIMYLAAGATTAMGLAAILELAVPRVALTAVSVGLASAGRMLGDTARGIGLLLEEGHVELARQALPSLVGRDPSELNENEIARAVIESVAENTVDAVIATALFGVVLGPAGVALHRVVNTMDAIVGHRSDRYTNFGWASARFDDVLAFVPARATAACVMGLNPRLSGHILGVVRRDAHQHPSPNGGVAEAAFAAALGIRLGGANNYAGVSEDRGVLGDGRPAEAGDIAAAVNLASRVGVLVALAPMLAVGISELTHRWK